MTMFTVLGASGFIGRHLVAYLSSKGYDVWAPEKGDDAIFKRSLGHLFYCVGVTADFRSRPFDTVNAHVCLLADVLHRAHFDTLLYLSSTRVYMGGSSTDENAYLTVLPSDPSYLYNLSKLTGESLCHSCGRQKVRIARLSNVVGSDMDAQSGNLVADLIFQARQGRIVLRSHPDSSKDYIHIDDVVQWLVLIALHGEYSIYNLASGIQITHAQWLRWLAESYGCDIEIQNSAPVQSFMPINVTRLQTEFGVQPRPVWDSSKPW